jgi:thiosulfate dehydrogenase
MSRVSAAANFIRANMPFDQPGTLSDQQALDVAAYVNAHPRPDYAAKQYDWPHGDAPPDAAYATLAQQRKPSAGRH